MKKKVHGLWLAFAMCLVITCAFGGAKAKAALEVNPAGYDYTPNADGTCTLNGYTQEMAAQYNQQGFGSVYVPESLNGYKVTAMKEGAFANLAKVEKIFIYGSVALDATLDYVAADQKPVVYGNAGNVSVSQYAAAKGLVFTPFAQVTGVKATADTKTLRSATITWKAAAGVSYYTVERYDSKTKAYVNIGQTKASVCKYKVGGLKPGSSYTFRITPEYAADVLPFPGISSKSVKVTLKPAKVKGFHGKAHRGAITLSWKKSSNINGYQVQCLTHLKIKIKGFKPTYYTIKNITTTKYKSLRNRGLVKGMRYSYRIRTYKKIGKKKIYSDYVYANKIKCK